jgi:hypothetical protein
MCGGSDQVAAGAEDRADTTREILGGMALARLHP